MTAAKKKSTSSKSEQQSFDIAIIGGGPAGLSFARLLKDTGLKIAILERQAEADIANPTEDGRDIALTHMSAHIMQQMGAWDKMPVNEVSTIREAQVQNGTSPYSLVFDSAPANKPFLGYLVANHVIRKAVYETAKECAGVTIIDNASVSEVRVENDRAYITLKDGREVSAQLAIGADSRFSDSRRKMGISASMYEFGRAVIVCRVRHELPHGNVAFECFKYGMTLAILPMVGNVSSIVVTVPGDIAAEYMRMSAEDFSQMVEEGFEGRFGAMSLETPRHLYPLVAVYANRFATERYAVIGDAAVGMHPVTAHGFNFGLVGAQTLADGIKQALAQGRDFGAMDVLEKYARTHRMATRPLYLATNAVVKLFTDDRAPVRAVRGAVLRLGNLLSPLNRLVTAHLTKVPKQAA